MQLSPISNRNDQDNQADAIKQMLARGGNNFNFLRLVLASLVLLAHSFELIDGDRSREPLTRLFHTLSFGELAVDGFFLLSGFLIVRSWVQSPQFWLYLKKRCLRIYPGFFVAFWMSLLFVGALGSSLALAGYLGSINWLRQVFFLSFLLAPGASPVFEGQPFPALNGPMWTISYEFRCYIMISILGLIGCIKNRSLWLALTFALFVLYLNRSLLAEFHFPSSFYVFDIFTELIRLSMFFFAGGCFLFLERIRFNTITAILFVPIVIFAMYQPGIAEISLAIFGAYILFWFAFLKISFIDRFKHHSDVSYGLYLYGWPVQKLLLWYLPMLSPWLLFGVALVLSYGCGYISWNLVEKPALRWKRRTPRDPRLLSA